MTMTIQEHNDLYFELKRKEIALFQASTRGENNAADLANTLRRLSDLDAAARAARWLAENTKLPIGPSNPALRWVWQKAKAVWRVFPVVPVAIIAALAMIAGFAVEGSRRRGLTTPTPAPSVHQGDLASGYYDLAATGLLPAAQAFTLDCMTHWPEHRDSYDVCVQRAVSLQLGGWFTEPTQTADAEVTP